MIRVCFVVDAAFLGGAEYYVSRLATSLDRNRFDVSVLTRTVVDGDPLLPWLAELRREGIRTSAVEMRLPFHAADAARIWRAMEGVSADVMHVNLPGPYNGQNGLLAPIARAAGARVVVTEHLPMVAPTWKRAGLKYLASGFVDAAVTMTRANAAFVADRQGVPAGRVHVVPNGVPAAFGRRRAPRASRAEPVLVFLGNILPHKGLHRTLEALSMVARPWRLRVVGDGPDAARCRFLAAELGLAQRVEFMGSCPPAAVEEVLADADALVLPSEIEGMPYAILEAMASSLPVIAGRVYGVPEIVSEGETGLMVAPGDRDALSLALDRIIADGALRDRMGRAARARFEERFTLERQTAAMSGLYESLAYGSRGRRG